MRHNVLKRQVKLNKCMNLIKLTPLEESSGRVDLGNV